MDKLLIVIGLLFFGAMQSFGQLASWALLINGSPTQNATNVVAGSFTGGTGISAITYSTTGATASSWSTGLIDLTNYFEVYIAPATGYDLTIQSINFGERRSLTGIRAYEVQYSTNADFSSPVTLTTVNVPDDDLERIGNISGLNIIVNDGDTIYFRWYGYAAEGSTGTWRINDATLNILGLVSQINPNNNDSYVQDPVTQIPAGNISSLNTTAGQAVPVFKTKVFDAGSGDALPTNITQITIRNSLPTNSADWITTIQGITVLNGVTPVTVQQTTINANTIILEINSGDIIIPDGGSAELTFSVFLHSSNITDSTRLQLYIDHLSHNWNSDMNGSGFLPNFVSDVISNIFTIDVVATKLQFSTVAQSVWTNQDFIVTASATDINNNLDLSNTLQVVIQKNLGGGVLSSASGLTKTLSAGNVTWTDLRYDTPGYFSVLLTESTSTLTSVTSSLINCITSGQALNESFTDGDISANPAWIGETGDFIVTPEYRLQLFTTAIAEDTSYLVTPIGLQLDSIEWQVYIDLAISPSNSNCMKYFLISNNPIVKDTLHGYFIKIGEDLANDAIELFYQDGNIVTSICRGPNGQVAVSPKIRIKVIRTNTGLWRMYADPTGGSSFELQASGTENSYFSNGFYTGVFCRYTTSNDEGKFNFDDFYCGPVQVDSIHPTFVSLSVIDSMHLDVIFDEGISLSTAQNILNYSVNSGIGSPSSAVRDAMDYKIIHLTFSTAFTTGNEYILSANNLFDFAGNNLSQPVNHSFVWYKAVPFDIQINEIMADPSPVVGLPDVEFIELFNKTVYPIDLTGWTITIGSSTMVLPSSKIEATGYVLLCTSAAQASLNTYSTTIAGISSSSALTNAGTSVMLKNKENQIISYIDYSDSWYRSTSKKNGGWSLEQIDPLNPCGESSNWNAASDPSGGTPGRKNSVYRSNLDVANPELLRAILTLPDTLLLVFNETLFGGDSIDVTSFSVDHGIGNPVSAVFTDISKKKAILVFNQTFVDDTVYVITVTGQLKDCAGNLVTTSNNAQFVIPDSIQKGSFVINEILFNPYTGGTDYIELYNNSTGIYDLKEAKLTVADDTTLFPITTEGFYLFPGEYAVLSTEPNQIYPYYSCPNKKAFIKLDDMPSYNTDMGRVSLTNKSLQFIDDFSYSESMQFQLLNDFKGVSLERIHPDYSTQDAKNWHSAAESAGFGTPGYKNSQYAQFSESNGQITIEPEVFSPDNDGRDDILNIRYKFELPGYVANVTIFDAKGRKVKNLVVSEMLPTEGYFTWDGLNDANQKASIGIYVIYIEVFNLDGKTSQYKKTCVLASHLN